jgi:alkyldihydroxyacetonephosphate synthase
MWQGRPLVAPDRVCWPETASQVQEVLEWATKTGTTVVPYGAGSGVCGGAAGRKGSVVLDTKAFQQLSPPDEERWTVDAGAGVNGQQLEDHLNRHGFTLGHSPSSIWCSTVGGWAAARSAGQFSSKYGVFEDMVLSLTAVAPGRGVFTVGEEGDAPEAWMPLLLGSEGTLAVVTRVRMRIWPIPERRWLRGYRFRDVDAALKAMRELMQGELWPAVVRLYDPVDTRIGGKTKPKSDRSGNHGFLRGLLARVDKLDSVHKRSLVLPLSLPGVVNRIFERAASGCLVVVGWEGHPSVVEALSAAGHRILCREGEDLGAGPGERWFGSRHAVSYKLMPLFERGGFADTMEVATRWSEMSSLYEAVRAAVSKTAVVMAHMSHVYPEGGCIYFSFAGRGDREVYEETWRNALAAVGASGGTVTHHHGVGELKAAVASAEIGPAIAGWRAMKQDLDPANILNPGRLFIDVPHQDPGAPPAVRPEDGVARARADSDLPERRQAASLLKGSPMFPWESLRARPRWHRLPWQVSWTEVAGEVDGVPCRLGRGPRSAAGPDLRGWLATTDPQATATFAVVPDGDRWMGRGTPKRPWHAARELLRSDLRPAVLQVVDGGLTVGFRGPAASDLGRLASAWVPGGLEEVPWEDMELTAGPLEFCEMKSPKIVAVLPQGPLRRKS